ncbi:MAG: ABC transporter permease [Vicinamibacterales bacterium]
MSRLWLDVRHAVKALGRGRATTMLAVLVFALGIGATTAVFSIFYSVLLKPLPYPDPDRLVLVYDTQPACTTCPASLPKYDLWRTRNTVMAALGGSATGNVIVTGDGDPERVPSARVTPSLVNDVFRVPAALGRWFTEAEGVDGGPKVAVLGYGFWQRRYGGDAGVIGRTITLGGEPHEIVGVMPATFSHRRAEIFVPVQQAIDPSQIGNHFLLTYGRLKPGVSLEAARQSMIALGGELAKEFGYNHGIDVRSYYRAVVGNVEVQLRVLMAGVGLVLLIAAANVANLLLASGLARRRELAVRAALGASRWDLARQLTVESVLLAVAGGLVGVLFAAWATASFGTLAASVLPSVTPVAIDGWVVLFAAGVSLATGVLCGLWPVLRLRTRALAQAVREGDLRGGAQVASRRFGNGLVVAEIALAFVLLVGAGLLVKSLLGLERRSSGINPEHVVAFDVAPTGVRYQGNEPVRAFYRDLLPKLAAIGGVQAVGVTSHLPMYQFGWNGEVALEGGNPWQPNDAPLIEYRWIGGDYFKALGIELVRGRLFGPEDREGAPLHAILSESAAQKFWPDQDPIGRRVYKGGIFPNNPPWEVVGVVRDVRSYGLGRSVPYEMYASIEQQPFGAMTVAMRVAGADPTAVVPSARQVVKSIDPLLPVSTVQTMTAVVSESVQQPRLFSALATLFGVLAGLLAAVGVYGVMAYNVRRERREFGVRLALGADPRRVRRLVVGRGLLLGVLGIAIGAAGAYWLTGYIRSVLADVQPTDPTVFASAAGLLLFTAVMSVYWPARQAGRTDPMVALRNE